MKKKILVLMGLAIAMTPLSIQASARSEWVKECPILTREGLKKISKGEDMAIAGKKWRALGPFFDYDEFMSASLNLDESDKRENRRKKCVYNVHARNTQRQKEVRKAFDVNDLDGLHTQAGDDWVLYSKEKMQVSIELVQ